MPRLSDEQYFLMEDTKEKSITARSARYTRTHNGKGGAVKFPSDNLTKKELAAMSGECKSYRLNSPMKWDEFKSMPDDLRVIYIKALREKYNVSDKDIAQYVLGVSSQIFGKWIRSAGLGRGKTAGGPHRVWDKEGFMTWASSGTKIDICDKEDLVAVNDEPEIVMEDATTPNPDNPRYDNDMGEAVKAITESTAWPLMDFDYPAKTKTTDICTNPYHFMPVIPQSGSMTFEHNHVDDALATIKSLLGNMRVNMTVSWICVNEKGE